MRFEPTKEVCILPAAPDAELRVVYLKALANVRAKRQVGPGVTSGERDVLEFVERLARNDRVRKHRPIFRPTMERNRGPSGRLGINLKRCEVQQSQDEE